MKKTVILLRFNHNMLIIVYYLATAFHQEIHTFS